MSKMSKNVTTESNLGDFTKPVGSSTSSKEKVAVAVISPKCTKMCKSPKVMATTNTAVSTHSVSDVRQINMAGNI